MIEGQLLELGLIQLVEVINVHMTCTTVAFVSAQSRRPSCYYLIQFLTLLKGHLIF